MQYISIDLETMGLDYNNRKIIEVAMIADDFKNPMPLAKLVALGRVFHTYVTHSKYEGDPVAMSMNSVGLRRIGMKTMGFDYTEEQPLALKMHGWLNGVLKQMAPNANHDLNSGNVFKVPPAGKNYGTFDLNFLKKLPNWGTYTRRLIQRTLDPGPLYVMANDVVPPSLPACLGRAGMEASAAHCALGDAWDVCRVLRFAYRDNWMFEPSSSERVALNEDETFATLGDRDEPATDNGRGKGTST